ncbi:4-epi-cubebol synthase [Streptosporangium sp. OZ121]|uniref:4-epi-cubebol synthase n=1 Tax=unclassified Streptosporangium TaxID=2632669 RepID=UPI003F78B3B1
MGTTTKRRSGLSLRIPPLPCPFPSEVNPHVERVNAETLDWLVDRGILEDAETVERYRQAKYGWLGARTYPYAEHHTLRLATDWCVWLFAFDDAFCESGRGAGEITRALPRLFTVLDDLEAGQEVDDVFAGALLEIKTRISTYGDDDQLDRWRAVTKDYLFAQVWEAANREADVVPKVDDYIFMRRRTGAMLTVFALIDLASGCSLTPEEWRHPDVKAITESANDVVVWDNDLISYAKESDSANSRNNLVSVLARHRGYSRQQAMEAIGAMRNRAIADMVALRPSLEALGSEAVLAYVRGLEFWISGSVDYSLTSSRYTGAWQQEAPKPPAG